MKNKLLMLVGAFAGLLTACQPSENRLELTNSFNPDDIKLEAIQATPGSNAITLKMTTPGVYGYWDYNIGTGQTDEVSFVYPMSGTHTFTFHVYNQYIDGSLSNVESDITRTIDVEIAAIEVDPAPAYGFLVGKEYLSKKWEFAGEPYDEGLWFFMSGAGAFDEKWWNAGGNSNPEDGNNIPFDVEGYMEFNLDGAANMLHYEYDGATPEEGVFSFDGTFSKFYTSGDATILGALANGEAAPITEFTIIELTDDSFKLFCPACPTGGTGWCWAFRPVAE